MKSKIDLSGMWEFCLDGDKKGMEQEFYNRHFSDTIALPGTTSEAKKGGRREKREIGYLTEPYHFEGYAWYGREVEVKDYQPGDQVILKLERTRKSYVWIDGVGRCPWRRPCPPARCSRCGGWRRRTAPPAPPPASRPWPRPLSPL